MAIKKRFLHPEAIRGFPVQSLLVFFMGFFAVLFLSAGQASATGETCSVFDPCSHSYDYCRVISITESRCTLRGSSGDGCSGIGQGTCLSGLVCDVIGECRHSPPRAGEPCGIGVSCAAGLACSADVGGRCYAPGGVGDSCSGIGQGSCQSGLVCDANRTCRHDPPQVGEPCGTGVSCAGDLYCSSPVAGTCTERGSGGDPCLGLGQGTCQAGLVCDALLECRHVPGELGELCGLGVPCIDTLGCSADVGGRCEQRGASGDTCSGTGQGSCQSGLVCDANRTCRHDPPITDEPCGIGVACGDGLVCSADIGGTCGPRGKSGDSCSGIVQGSCEPGLVCDGLQRVCRHEPSIVNEPCGPLVSCADQLFCQPGTQVCKRAKTVGEGCSVFNQCLPNLSCEPCFTDSCDYPFECFPNANKGPITQTECLTLYSPNLHQSATNLGLARDYATGTGAAAGVSKSLAIGVVYGPDGKYGCFTSDCDGFSTDVSISAFVQIGFYNDYGVFAGSSTAFVQNAGVGVGSFSTSQVFTRYSLDPFGIGPLIGTEDALALGVSPEDIVIPISAGVYACETQVDTVIGNEGQPGAMVCGNGTVDPGEGCDDGNLVDGDGCSSNCVVEATCGDGILDPGEGCDDGNNVNGDGCSAQCTIEPRCGDGNLDPGEACDDGNNIDGDGCSAQCTIEPVCGNGLIESGESCDDGNTVNGDGCSSTCQIEAPAVTGDLDGDGDVDQNDISVILQYRNTSAENCPACDLDSDGIVTVLDMRKAVLLCTRPRCAVE